MIVDNASTYEPLLAYLEASEHTTIRLTENAGFLAPWSSGAVDRHAGPREHYVVTDPDVIPDEGCPPDAVRHFHDVLQRYEGYVKCGFGLRIDDIPAEYEMADLVRSWEAKFWLRRLERGLYRASIDTTFALYRPGVPFSRGPAIRTGPPYIARHMSWYQDSAHPSDEDRFYAACATQSSNWVSRDHGKSIQNVRARESTLSIGDRIRWNAHVLLKVKPAQLRRRLARGSRGARSE